MRHPFAIDTKLITLPIPNPSMKAHGIVKTLLATAVSMALFATCAMAGHPLILNGILKSISDTTVQLGDTTLTMLPGCKISFDDGPGTVAEVTAAIAQNSRLVGVIRRDAPDSTNIVALVVKANKPVAPAASAPTAPVAETPAEPEAAE